MRPQSQQLGSNRHVFLLTLVAMKAMNKVASHINEMQKIHEEYGSVFDQLITEQSSEKKEVGRDESALSSSCQPDSHRAAAF